MSLFQPPGYIRSLEWAKLFSLTSAVTSTTPLQDLPSPPPLLLLLDVPFPDLKNLFLCRLARVHQEDRSSFTRKSSSLSRTCLPKHSRLSITSQLALKIVLASALLTFPQVTSPLKNVLANALVTFTRKSFHAVFIRFGKACHCGTAFFCGAAILLLRA